MKRDEIKDCILRLLLVYPISPVHGYNLEDIDSYLSSLLPEFDNKAFTQGLEAILTEMVTSGDLETHEVTPGYVVLTEKKTVTFYQLSEGGRNKAMAINNQTIIYAIPETKGKDLTTLNHCLKSFTPYIKFTPNKLRGLVKECVLKLPLPEQLRLHDHKMTDRFFDFLLNNGFIEQIDAEQYEFNLRGRKLVEKGDYASFVNWENEQAKKESDKKDLEFNLLKSQSEFQKLNNDFIAKQSALIDNQIATNDSVIKTNKNIINSNFTVKIILWLTVGAALLQAFPAWVTMMRDIRINSMQRQIDTLTQEQRILQNRPFQREKKADSSMKILEKIQTKPLDTSSHH